LKKYCFCGGLLSAGMHITSWYAHVTSRYADGISRYSVPASASSLLPLVLGLAATATYPGEGMKPHEYR